MRRDKQALRLTQMLLWISAIATAGYAAAYLGGLRLSHDVPDCGRQLQVAQLPSSIWTATAAGLGAFGIGRRRRWGLFMAIAAASAALYIGLRCTERRLPDAVGRPGTGTLRKRRLHASAGVRLHDGSAGTGLGVVDSELRTVVDLVGATWRKCSRSSGRRRLISWLNRTE